MSQLTCLRVAEWIQARRAGLQPAAAIRLEEHLAHCASCSVQARTLDRLQDLSDEGASPLPVAVRRRAVARALATAAEERAPREALRSGWFVPSAVGALAALALVALGVALRPDFDAPVARGRVLSGVVELAGRPLATGDTVPSDATLQTESGAVVALAHAKVELRAHTRARWDGPARLLHLEEGSVISEVDPLRRASFGVETQHFRALVLGTRFEVSLDRVRVVHGRVQVVARDGRSLAVLGAGESYQWHEPSPQLAAAKAPPSGEPEAALRPSDGTPVSARSKRTDVRLRSKAAHAPPKPEAARPRPTAADAPPVGKPSIADPQPSAANAPQVAKPAGARPQPKATKGLLEEARIALGRRELDRARVLVAEAWTSATTSRERAEALTLRAECALVAGDLSSAARGYYEVAESFPRLTAGENALFAGARIDADRLRGPSAERGLTRYLARYPRGRFVKEANARLRELRGQASRQP